jgi:hypothetical protein
MREGGMGYGDIADWMKNTYERKLIFIEGRHVLEMQIEK